LLAVSALAGMLIWPGRFQRRADEASGARPALGPSLASKEAAERDPFEMYFTGHWCDDWRLIRLNVQDMGLYDGALPRGVCPGWGKIKLLRLDGLTPPEKMLVRAFAGLINRRIATWYIVDDDENWLRGRKAPWNDGVIGPPLTGIFRGGSPLSQQVGGPPRMPIGQENGDRTYLWACLKRFCNQIEPDPPRFVGVKGFVLYDGALFDPNARPNQPRAVLNAVRTICALENALPLTPELERDFRNVGWEDNGYRDLINGLPVILDTTRMDEWNIANHGGDEEAAARHVYTWLFNNYWEKCVQQALAFLPPTGPDGQDHDLTDYIVQFGLFTFFVEGAENVDEKELELILSKTPLNTPIIGSLTRPAGAAAEEDRRRLLRLFSRFGKYFVEAQGASNLSLHSGERGKQRESLRQSPPPARTYSPNKTYIAFALTTRNSLGAFLQDRCKHWEMASRGQLPLGWAVPLTAADACPNITKYYYKTATPNDCFLADIAGMGDMVPAIFGAATDDPARVLDQFLQTTNHYMNLLDLHVLWADQLDSRRRLDQYIAGLPQAQAILYGLDAYKGKLERAGNAYDRIGFFYNYLNTRDSRQMLADLPNELADTPEKFLFIGVDETQFGRDEDVVGWIAQAAQRLNPQKFEVVRPDELAGLLQQAVAAKAVAPGLADLQPRWAKGKTPLALPRLARGGVAIDGRLEDWAKVALPPLTLGRAGDVSFGRNSWKGAADASATAYVAYDDQYLYVAANVRDDTVYVDDVARGEGDSVELLIDARPGSFRSSTPSEGFYRLCLVPAAGLVDKPEVILRYPTFDTGLVNRNQHGISHTIAAVRTPEGYRVEAAIPLLNFPKASWKPGAQLAFGLAVNDLDQGGQVETRLQWQGGNAARDALQLVPARLL
jgi:hypothetical protein